MSEAHAENLPETVPPRSSRIRLLIPLIAGALIAGLSFWWGYNILSGQVGWVGEGRRYVGIRCFPLRDHLVAYHAEHGVYPDSLRRMLEEHFAKQNETLNDEIYEDFVHFSRHPVVYEPTDAGWRLTDYGDDGQPGGVGLDADMVFTSDMDDDAFRREGYHGRYRATFAQVYKADGGSYFWKLVGTSLALGGAVFVVTFLQVRLTKRWHIAASILPAVAITVAAGFVGMIIMIVHNIASGH